MGRSAEDVLAALGESFMASFDDAEGGGGTAAAAARGGSAKSARRRSGGVGRPRTPRGGCVRALWLPSPHPRPLPAIA